MDESTHAWQNRLLTQLVPTHCIVRMELAELASYPCDVPPRRSSWTGPMRDARLGSRPRHAVRNPLSKIKRYLDGVPHKGRLRRKLVMHSAEKVPPEDDEFGLLHFWARRSTPKVETNTKELIVPASLLISASPLACTTHLTTSCQAEIIVSSLSLLIGSLRTRMMAKNHPYDGNKSATDRIFAAEQERRPRGYGVEAGCR